VNGLSAWKTLVAHLVLVFPGLAALPEGALAGPSGYRRIATFAVGGLGSWDYLTLDSAHRRLFISREKRVVVLDLDRGKVVGEIPDTLGVHGVALAPDLGRGFTSNGGSASVTIFDVKTLKVIGTVQTDEGPDAIVYDPQTGLVVTMNGRGRSATTIDAASGQVKGTLALEGKPEFAVADGRGRIFVNLEDQSAELELDPLVPRIVHRWSLAPCVEPSGLAIDRAHRRLFAGCHNHMMAVIDADSGKVIATPAIGAGVDANAFDAATQLAFSANGDGTLTVVREEAPDDFRVTENVKTKPGARTVALDEKTHNVYLVAADFGPSPAPTSGRPHPRPPILADSFVVLVYGMGPSPAQGDPAPPL
jgi:DNA-binding beta-propeller fold protein YncE